MRSFQDCLRYQNLQSTLLIHNNHKGAYTWHFLQDLIAQIEDAQLRVRILAETNKLLKQKKFGLVFEEHLPECTPLYDIQS